MPRVVHFEIHAGDPDRAVNFYKTSVWMELSKMGRTDGVLDGHHRPGRSARY